MSESSSIAYSDISIIARYRDPNTINFIEAECYDISKGGMFVRSSSPPPPGTLIKFECKVGDGSQVIMGVGRVVWQRKEEGPDMPSGMGIKFLVLQPGSSKVIDRILKGASAEKLESKRKSSNKIPKPSSHIAQQLTEQKAQKIIEKEAYNEEVKTVAKKAEERAYKRTQAKAEAILNISEPPVQGQVEVQRPVIIIKNGPEEAQKIVSKETVKETVKETIKETKTAEQVPAETETQEPSQEPVEEPESVTKKVLELAAKRRNDIDSVPPKPVEEPESISVILGRIKKSGQWSPFNSTWTLRKIAMAGSLAMLVLLPVVFVLFSGEKSPEQIQQSPQTKTVDTSAPPIKPAASLPFIDKASANIPTSQDSKSSVETIAEHPEQPPVIAKTEEPEEPDKAQSKDRKKESSSATRRRTNLNRRRGVWQKAATTSILAKEELLLLEPEPDSQSEPEQKSRYEQATDCLKNNDNSCIVQLLSGHARSPKEISLLIETYKSMGEKEKALEQMSRYVQKFPNTRRARSYRDILEETGASRTIPLNPY